MSRFSGRRATPSSLEHDLLDVTEHPVHVVGRSPLVGLDEVGVLGRHRRRPDPEALEPDFSMSRPAAAPVGLVNTLPAFCPTGLVLAAQRTMSAMSASERPAVTAAAVSSAATTTSSGPRADRR